MFISFYTTIYFFLKKFSFLNVYVSVNAIFECLFMMFFGSGRDQELSTYATDNWWGMEGSSKMLTTAYGVSRLKCTYLHYLFSYFWQDFCLIVVSCFICRNFELVIRGFDFVTIRFEFELVDLNS